MTSPEDYKIKVIEEVYSPINGVILVTTNPLLGFNIINSEKIAISGDMLQDIFSYAIGKTKPRISKIDRCLILGFGVGKVAKYIRNIYPDSNITGVEIDPKMIEIGKKYFALSDSDAEIEIGDAFKTCQKFKKNNKSFDLIIVDLFIGDLVPEKFETRKFVILLQQILSHDGNIIFNRIYTKVNKERSDGFRNKVGVLFNSVIVLKYKNNLLLICKR